jgi:lipopolysaccharide biosynthesis protein
MKTLVLYVFHQYNDRVKKFIDHAIFQAEDVDFIVISNGSSFEVPSYVMKLQRDNIGFDFGGWSDALLHNDLYKSYDTFIFVNSSVSGPFLDSGRWTDVYLAGLTDSVKLFGSTINTCCNYANPKTHSHVQSYIFAMNRETLEFLMNKGIFSKEYAQTFNDAVWKKEVPMSRMIIEKGWNIGSRLKIYDGVDFVTCNFKHIYDDVMYPPYRNVLWTDKELVFIKGNRCNV